jgi:hypothetical protein
MLYVYGNELEYTDGISMKFWFLADEAGVQTKPS